MASQSTIRVIPLDDSGEEFKLMADMADGLYITDAGRTYAYGPYTFEAYNAYADDSREGYERPEEGELTILVSDGVELKSWEQNWDSDGYATWSTLTRAEARLPRPKCEACGGSGDWVRNHVNGVPSRCPHCLGTGEQPFAKALCRIGMEPAEVQALVEGRVTLPPDTRVIGLYTEPRTLSHYLAIEGPDIPQGEPGTEARHCDRFQEFDSKGNLSITFEPWWD